MTEEKFEELRSVFKIRKLMPEECFILQGMKAEDCIKARNLGVSNSQLYKQAGNGLSCNVVAFLGESLKKMYNSNFVTTWEKCVEKYGEIK